MVREVAAAVWLLCCSLCSCSGQVEDGDGNGGSAGKTSKPEPSPETRCQTYASTWCNKAFGCYVKVGRIDQSLLESDVSSCIDVIVTHLPCSAVTSVNSTNYDKCNSQIKGMACSRWDVPQTQFASVAAPEVCSDVFSFE